METITLTLKGPVPSKKNQWRPARGRIVLDRDAKAKIEALVTQARIQWGPRPAAVHPDMDVTFFVANTRSDRDNKLSCILDVLQAARVIANDSTEQFNGCLCVLPAIQAREEVTILTITVGAR